MYTFLIGWPRWPHGLQIQAFAMFGAVAKRVCTYTPTCLRQISEGCRRAFLADWPRWPHGLQVQVFKMFGSVFKNVHLPSHLSLTDRRGMYVHAFGRLAQVSPWAPDTNVCRGGHVADWASLPRMRTCTPHLSVTDR